MANIFPPSFILNYLWKETTGNFTIFQTMGLNFFLNDFLCSVRNIWKNNALCVFVYFCLFSPKFLFPPSPFLGTVPYSTKWAGVGKAEPGASHTNMQNGELRKGGGTHAQSSVPRTRPGKMLAWRAVVKNRRQRRWGNNDWGAHSKKREQRLLMRMSR